MYNYIYSHQRRKTSQLTSAAMILAITANIVAYYCSGGGDSPVVPAIGMPFAKAIFLCSLGVSVCATLTVNYCYRRKYRSAVYICAMILIYQPFIIFFAAMR